MMPGADGTAPARWLAVGTGTAEALRRHRDRQGEASGFESADILDVQDVHDALSALHEGPVTVCVVSAGVIDARPSAALRVLREQIDRCKSILATLSASAGTARAEGGRCMLLEDYLNELLRDWKEMRLGIRAQHRFDGPRPSPLIVAEQTLTQAIVNILNNAADASPDNIEISARWNAHELELEICDRGAGLTPDAEQAAGRPFFTTKAPGEGLGLGLFLAHATLNRFGGSVHLYNREGGGVCTRLTLPLSSLRVEGSA